MITDDNTKQTKEHWPKDTDDAFYLLSVGQPLADILRHAQTKWPDSTPETLSIEAEYIHLYCVGYDQYDPSDWGLFLRIERLAE